MIDDFVAEKRGDIEALLKLIEQDLDNGRQKAAFGKLIILLNFYERFKNNNMLQTSGDKHVQTSQQ